MKFKYKESFSFFPNYLKYTMVQKVNWFGMNIIELNLKKIVSQSLFLIIKSFKNRPDLHTDEILGFPGQ
mgnify:CR=1 FL=1